MVGEIMPLFALLESDKAPIDDSAVKQDVELVITFLENIRDAVWVDKSTAVQADMCVSQATRKGLTNEISDVIKLLRNKVVVDDAIDTESDVDHLVEFFDDFFGKELGKDDKTKNPTITPTPVAPITLNIDWRSSCSARRPLGYCHRFGHRCIVWRSACWCWLFIK